MTGFLKYPCTNGRGNVLFNDTLNTFYLRLYGGRHMVKDHSDSERGNPLPPHGLIYQLAASDTFDGFNINIIYQNATIMD